MRIVDEFDVMLEAKGKDLALLRLRSDLHRYAPDVVARFRNYGSDDHAPAEDFLNEEGED